jgi:hypothetical protein
LEKTVWDEIQAYQAGFNKFTNKMKLFILLPQKLSCFSNHFGLVYKTKFSLFSSETPTNNELYTIHLFNLLSISCTNQTFP